MKPAWLLYLMLCFFFSSCIKEDDRDNIDAKVIFRYKFDSTLERLGNDGQPASLKEGNGALSPVLNAMSVYHIELMPAASTPFEQGVVLFKAPGTTEGGEKAIDLSRQETAGNYEVFFAIPLKDIPPGEYEWLRVAPAYQQYAVSCHLDTTITVVTDTSSVDVLINDDFPATVAFFPGYNTYISSLLLRTLSLDVQGNRRQGFWGFEANYGAEVVNETDTLSGQLTEGGMTVVNPISDSSPVPPEYGVITAAFRPGKLVITGKETENIIVEVSFSTNHSFEWQEIIPNAKWDPWKGEPLMDLGLRGMVPEIQE